MRPITISRAGTFVAAVASMVAVAATTAAPAAAQTHLGASMKLRYDAALLGSNGGDWYLADDNEGALLAWGQSYVMASLLVMYQATADAAYLDRLVKLSDGVLAQRDSERAVTDYRGQSNACWRATQYSSKPYCWAVHTGIIATPMVELAALIDADPALAARATYDGMTKADNAPVFLEAGEAAAAVHDDEWRASGASSGYYVIRPDATFMPDAGSNVPLNMMNAMGLLHLALADATGSEEHLDRARRLATHLSAYLDGNATGGFRWNYRASAFAAPGEDVSHAALNVDFARRAWAAGLVFEDADMSGFANTFMQRVYIDQATSYDHVGGTGDLNGSSYRLQLGRWTLLSDRDPSVHAAVRDMYADYPTTTSGSLLLSMAMLTRTDQPVRSFEFYVADWEDQGDRRRATAANANILAQPIDPAAPQLVRIVYSAGARTPVEQWDGEAYHHVVTLAATGGEMVTAHLPYHPELWFDYGGKGALFQLAGAAGIVLMNPEPLEPPQITSEPPTHAAPGDDLVYFATASGQGPQRWSAQGPVHIEEDTGVLVVDTSEDGDFDVLVRVANDHGADEQSWVLSIGGATGPGADGDEAGDDGDGVASASGPSAGAGCGCRAAGAGSSGRAAVLGLLGLFICVRARRRRPSGSARPCLR
ncbi:MAG: hypothetical protein WKG00_23600 [Polyangiaceae bacterium]